MAKMGGTRHLKRLAAPWFWPVLRKEYKWVVKPSPGPHSIDRSIPLMIVVRDILGYAKTAKEAKYIIQSGKVLVDGVVRKDYKFPIGIMDVVAIPEIELYTRFIPYPTKYLWFTKIPREEANLKIVRIENKVTVKGGHMQLNLSDGRNLVLRVKDPKHPIEVANFATLDSLLIEIPSQQIIQHIKLAIGKLAIVIDGKNTGRIGKIVNMDVKPGLKRRKSVVTLEDMQGHRFQTILDYIMVVGDEKPLLTLSS